MHGEQQKRDRGSESDGQSASISFLGPTYPKQALGGSRYSHFQRTQGAFGRFWGRLGVAPRSRRAYSLSDEPKNLAFHSSYSRIIVVTEGPHKRPLQGAILSTTAED